MEFCASRDLISLPASTLTVARFITYLARTCKFSTINNYLSSVIVLHKYYGHPAEFRNTFYIQLVVRGLCRILGDTLCQSIPLSLEQLLACYNTINHGNTEELASWGAVTFGFHTLLRKSNVLPELLKQPNLPHITCRKGVLFFSLGNVDKGICL